MHRSFSRAVLVAVAAASSLSANAFAHISLERGGTHLSRYGDDQTVLKDPPCGKAGGTRGAHVYTYAPGQTIDVSIVEYIPHPSYFRIAFDQDGDDGFKDPASILPIDPGRACPDGPGDHCGASDFYNTPEVLPGMDNLNPHIPSLADIQNPPKYTWHVTLPNVECDNCTLQVIQVMEDDVFHGPYDPTPGVGVADIYHQCIDIVLHAGTANGGQGGSVATGSGGSTSASAGGSGTTGAAGATNPSGGGTTASGSGGSTPVGTGSGGTFGTSNGGLAGAPGTPAASDASSGDTGGCAVSARASGSNRAGAWIVAGVAFGLRRRRRR